MGKNEPIPNRNQLAADIRSLKEQGMTDKEVADALGITIHRVGYIRYWYGIGGKYGKYKLQLQDEPFL